MVARNIDGVITAMEQTIGVAPGFFERLVTDQGDDWSYVIKLHALLEAALTHLLTTYSNKPEMATVYARLDTSDMETGKLAFARSLELLNKDQCKFVQAISNIRNKFVHDVKNAGMTLDQYYGAWDKNQKKSFIDAVAIGRPHDWSILIVKKKVLLRNFIQENIKLGLWFGALDLLSEIYLQRERLLVEQDYAKFGIEQFKWLDS